ncbi:MAG: hemagglutinin repeat-containing protein [Veillonella caviae]|uniref:hemagglutinin repeat-containing protein n=1 Tax=Veillonella caviae TaxID=248316 RepID=UPI002A915F0F|nr:hemagglutinin repeat-containing protein [Veillonella caviae]MDY5715229.1 hemagglutinin repeat-containing protein [Veillonella caviae]
MFLNVLNHVSNVSFTSLERADGQRKETISGKTVKLLASNDVSLQAATNISEKLENAQSKGWSVGANISVAGGGIRGFDASANAAKQKSSTKVTTHTGTTVVGSDAVTITSGKDTHISGFKVIGKSVTADVGGNLSIESLQDTKESLNKLDEIFDNKN